MSPIPNFRVATAAALSLVLASAAHAAADPAPTDAATKPRDSRTAPEPAPAEEPRLICEQVQQMGSHFRRKVCATPEAWEARRRKDAAQMEKMGDQGSGCGGVANPC
jgi:hypothetical protein